MMHDSNSDVDNEMDGDPCVLSRVMSCNRDNCCPALEKRLRKVYSPRYDRWLRSYGVVSAWETPKPCREKFIWHGYRPNPSSPLVCIRSIFSPTNETMNVWTHFIPCLIIIWRMCTVYTSLESPFDLINGPFWIQSFGCFEVLLVSSMAHTFNSMSPAAYDNCYCADYAGIVLCGATTVLASEYYLCPVDCFQLTSGRLSYVVYNAVIMMCAFFTHTLSCRSRDPANRPDTNLELFTKRIIPFIATYIVFKVPCFVRFSVHVLGMDGLVQGPATSCDIAIDRSEFVYFTILHYFFLSASTFVFASRCPERWFPGTFDIFGHSHQIFHVLIASGIVSYNIFTEHGMRHANRLVKAGVVDRDDVWNNWVVFAPVVVMAIALTCNTVKHSRALKLRKREHESKRS